MNHQEPNFPERSMFSLPTLSGHHQLQELVHALGGPEATCKALRIAPQALEGYLTGVMEPPYTLLLAVYWQGPYGFKQAFSETHWANQSNYVRAKAAEARCDQFRLLFDQVRQIVGPAFEVLLKSNGLGELAAPVDLAPLPRGIKRRDVDKRGVGAVALT